MANVKRVLFLGSKRLGLRCLERMHSLDPASLVGAGVLDDRQDTRSVFEEFCAFAARSDVEWHIVNGPKSARAVTQRLKPDLCIVVGWYWLIDAETLGMVPGRFLGLHNSLLPRYRGAAPVVWAMINGERTVGLSLFSLTPGMDDGDVWAQRSVPVRPDDYVSDVLSKLEEAAESMFDEAYIDILEGRATPTPQNHREATYGAARVPGDGFIPWDKPTVYIYNFIRAQSEPYPGAFTVFHGRRLTVWRVHLDNSVYYGTPGQVARVGPGGVHVIGGDHRAVVMEVVQGAAGKEPAHELVTSIRTRFPIRPPEEGRLPHHDHDFGHARHREASAVASRHAARELEPPDDSAVGSFGGTSQAGEGRLG